MFEPFASPAPLSRRHFSRARDMSTARLVIVTACYGSRGDVAPLARLARAIQTATKATDDDERPSSVVFMANPHFAELATGLDFHPTGDAGEYEARLADSKGRKHYGNGSVVDWWMRQLGTHVRAMRALLDGSTARRRPWSTGGALALWTRPSLSTSPSFASRSSRFRTWRPRRRRRVFAGAPASARSSSRRGAQCPRRTQFP